MRPQADTLIAPSMSAWRLRRWTILHNRSHDPWSINLSGVQAPPSSRVHTALPPPSLPPCLSALACAHGHRPDIHGREARLVEGLVGRNRVGLR